jgi:hypothetical protein
MRKADEAFLCGTAIEIVPVAELDGIRIGRSSPGPVTGQIRSAFDRAKTGASREWAHWVHRVAVEDPMETAVSR